MSFVLHVCYHSCILYFFSPLIPNLLLLNERTKTFLNSSSIFHPFRNNEVKKKEKFKFQEELFFLLANKKRIEFVKQNKE